MAMPTILILIEEGGKISSEKKNSIELNQKPFSGSFNEKHIIAKQINIVL